jgi:hypothetical protein
MCLEAALFPLEKKPKRLHLLFREEVKDFWAVPSRYSQPLANRLKFPR